MELRTWVLAELDDLTERFDRGVGALVPVDRWAERAGGVGSSVAFLVWHTAWHADLAVRAVVRGEPPLLDEWAERLTLDDAPRHAGLAEAEPVALSAFLEPDELGGYLAAVEADLRAWVAGLDPALLATVPPARQRMVEVGGVDVGEVPWLAAMWDAKPVEWFLRWEGVGHRQQHLGEMISVRNRLGLSPF